MEEIYQNSYFEDLLTKYEKLVFSICYRMTNNYFDAQDLTQETFISVYKVIESFDEKNEKAYITRITTNKCLDHLKNAERRTMPSENEELERGSPPVDSAEKQVMEIVVMEQLEKCCNRLKEPYKTVAYEYFYKGKTAKEIAEHINANVHTVQTQIRRVRKVLRTQWDKEELR
ncbi:RNA polymerase sigma factor [uncultured Eubacterium sp.]|uniref:RNA polymerase sigma factor n=1 Tax=uncultured Eubacterium sp. TaxID=165185 RepID=UPI002631E4B8|nr:sigma-70 family RNA polymerase sigma factor [uncultured Eubacterium sp.]